MLEKFFVGIFSTDQTSLIGIGDFLFCILCALLLGGFLAASYIYKSEYTKSFVVTLAIIPAVVGMIIMMVNGNIGTGVAVAGAFSLTRFRSVPGTAKEIGAIFIAMGTGLSIGMGYLGYATLFTIILCSVMVIYARSKFGEEKQDSNRKILRITIPEDLDYTNIFDDIFDKYTKTRKVLKVKTTNMGSMFRISYDILLNDFKKEKEMIDEIRCRNGNLEISVSNQETEREAL